MVTGQASVINYELSETTLILDKVQYDRLAEYEITLKNSGNIGFEFSADDSVQETTENMLPKQVCMWPKYGMVAPHSEIKLKISFLPGTPEKFCSEFFITVAHFQSRFKNISFLIKLPKIDFKYRTRNV